MAHYTTNTILVKILELFRRNLFLCKKLRYLHLHYITWLIYSNKSEKRESVRCIYLKKKLFYVIFVIPKRFRTINIVLKIFFFNIFY